MFQFLSDPLILITKQDSPDSELDREARLVKAKPPLLTLDNKGVDEIISDQLKMKRSEFYEKMFDNQNVELMRGAFTKYVYMLRGGILRDLRAQRILNFWSHHTQNVQAHRRAIEVRSQGQQPIQPYLPPQMTRGSSWGNNQGDGTPDDRPMFGKHIVDMQPYPDRRDQDDYRGRQDRRDNDRGDWNDRWGVRQRDRGQFRVRDISPGKQITSNPLIIFIFRPNSS